MNCLSKPSGCFVLSNSYVILTKYLSASLDSCIHPVELLFVRYSQRLVSCFSTVKLRELESVVVILPNCCIAGEPAEYLNVVFSPAEEGRS